MQFIGPGKAITARVSRRAGWWEIKIDLKCRGKVICFRRITGENARTDRHHEIIDGKHAKGEGKHTEAKHDSQIKAWTEWIADWEAFGQQP